MIGAFLGYTGLGWFVENASFFRKKVKAEGGAGCEVLIEVGIPRELCVADDWCRSNVA